MYSGKITIAPTELLRLFEHFGFKKLRRDTKSFAWINITNNISTEIDEVELMDCIRGYLTHYEQFDVLNALFKGANKINAYLMKWLKAEDIEFYRDSKDAVCFFFQNGFLEITAEGMNLKPYNELTKPVWRNQIKDHSFTIEQATGDFHQFLNNLANQDEHRFKVLQSHIGYMISTYKNPAYQRAWIVTDKNVGFTASANGGTGKSLISKALAVVRDTVDIDGKSIKKRLKSWYLWEKVNRDTCIINLQDYQKGVEFSNFYSIITDGFDIQKRGKAILRLDYSESPKLMISSNHPVVGDIGNSDARRRLEFEVSDHYNSFNTPVDEFGKLFFLEWNTTDWNNFYATMAYCSQVFLQEGAIQAEPYNFGFRHIASQTGPMFVAFADKYLIEGNRFEKAELLGMLKSEYPDYANVTTNRLKKYIDIYARYRNKNIEQKYSNGKNLVIVNAVETASVVANLFAV